MAFAKGETDVKTVEEVAGAFIQEYLSDYEVLLAVHDDKEHLHAHILFNSISFQTGKKYHYKNGDWQKDIQPITDRLCGEKGLSMILTDADDRSLHGTNTVYPEWEGKKLPIKRKILRDLEEARKESFSYPAFLSCMKTKGYEIRQGKHLSFKPPFDNRFFKGERLDKAYGKEALVTFFSERNLGMCWKRNPAPGIRKQQVILIQRRIQEAKEKNPIRYAQKQIFRRLMRQNTYLYRHGITSRGKLAERKEYIRQELKRLFRRRDAVYRALRMLEGGECEEGKKTTLEQEKQKLTQTMRTLRRELALIGTIEQDSIRYEKQQRNRNRERGVKREDGRDR